MGAGLDQFWADNSASNWGDRFLSLDFGDATGHNAAKQQRKDNRANLETQRQLAQQAQDYFAQQSAAGIGYIQEGTGQASEALSGYSNDAISRLNQGMQASGEALGTGLDQSLGSLGAGYQQARGDIGAGYGQGRSDLASGYGQSRAALGQLAGTQAIGATDAYGQSMLAQPGGLYAGFEQDPGYQFRLKQGEEAINRQAAAQGGRGGGATMKALADYNQGLASQEYANFAQRQQAAAGLQSGLLQNQAGRQDAAALAAQGYQASGLGQLGQAGMQYGQSQAGLSTQQGNALGGMAYGYGGQQAGMQNEFGQNISDLYQQGFGAQSGMMYGTGQSLADLYSQSGRSQADIAIGVGTSGQQGANSLMGAYNDAMNNNLAINQNESNQRAGLIGGILAAFSDERLKRDIELAPDSPFDRIGLRWYRWVWNTKANKLGYFGTAEGVLAQEVAEKYPHAVIRDEGSGWLMVNYDALDALARGEP